MTVKDLIEEFHKGYEWDNRPGSKYDGIFRPRDGDVLKVDPEIEMAFSSLFNSEIPEHKIGLYRQKLQKGYLQRTEFPKKYKKYQKYKFNALAKLN